MAVGMPAARARISRPGLTPCGARGGARARQRAGPCLPRVPAVARRCPNLPKWGSMNGGMTISLPRITSGIQQGPAACGPGIERNRSARARCRRCPRSVLRHPPWQSVAKDRPDQAAFRPVRAPPGASGRSSGDRRGTRARRVCVAFARQQPTEENEKK